MRAGRDRDRTADPGRPRRGPLSAAGTAHGYGGGGRAPVPNGPRDDRREAQAPRAAFARRSAARSQPDRQHPDGHWARVRRGPRFRRTARRSGARPCPTRAVPRRGGGALRMAGVWVLAQLSGHLLDPATLELLSAGRSLDPEPSAIVLGAGAREHVGELARHGARRIFLSEDPVYDEYLAEPAVHALVTLAAEHGPDLILF